MLAWWVAALALAAGERREVAHTLADPDDDLQMLAPVLSKLQHTAYEAESEKIEVASSLKQLADSQIKAEQRKVIRVNAHLDRKKVTQLLERIDFILTERRRQARKASARP